MYNDEDIDRIVDELNTSESGSSASTTATETAKLMGWLDDVIAREASDLLLVSGASPSVRLDGHVRPLPDAPLDSLDIETAVLGLISSRARRVYREHQIVDASFRFKSRRFRLNLHRERGRAAAAIRLLPAEPPTLARLGLPKGVEQLSHLPRGLVLIGGPTGSGKSTTLAAFVNEINSREERHIVTIEDPVEYEHPHKMSIVEHVEIGIDAPNFPTALRSAVRQAPDVLVVGEMRDPETMQMALAAAETGHLVFSTVHTGDIASAVSRIADGFPPERQHSIRQELSMALAAVLTQMLLPRIGGGRVPAAELLMVSYGARQHIRKNALQHLHQEISITRKQGSFTLEESLARLVHDGMVDTREGHTRAVHPADFESALAALRAKSLHQD
jgi:twitching motility protein PilT